MKKILGKIAGIIAVVVFVWVAFKNYRKWRDSAVNAVKDQEIKQGIEFGQERFNELVAQKVEAVAQAIGDEIENRWKARFNVGG